MIYDVDEPVLQCVKHAKNHITVNGKVHRNATIHDAKQDTAGSTHAIDVTPEEINVHNWIIGILPKPNNIKNIPANLTVSEETKVLPNILIPVAVIKTTKAINPIINALEVHCVGSAINW